MQHQLQQQLDWISAAIIGASATVFGHLFDVPPSALWIAFIGSIAGVAASETTALKAVLFIVIVTPATGWLLPFFMHYMPPAALNGMAFVLSFVLVAYWPLVRQQIPRLVVAVFDRATSIIRGPQP